MPGSIVLLVLLLPDSATRSVVSRPTAENLAFMFAKPSEGDGRAVLTLARFAVKLSLLPNGTSQDGPPDCRSFDIHKKRNFASLCI